MTVPTAGQSMAAYKAKLPLTHQPPCHTLFVGHNPSLSTWETGRFFANPSNRFWVLIQESGLHGVQQVESDDEMAEGFGFGFCDVLEQPGNNAGAIPKHEMEANIPVFLKRIENYATSMNGSLKRICFVGKRQWKHLFTPILSRCTHGQQDEGNRPALWPEQLEGIEVWILPSPSGRAVMNWEQRLAPYIDLAAKINASGQ